MSIENETRHSDEFKSFAEDLAVYAVKFVPEIRSNIAKHANEIFADKTTCKLLATYAKLKNAFDMKAKKEFVLALTDSDDFSDSCAEFDDRRLRSYSEVLDDLIWDKYYNC